MIFQDLVTILPAVIVAVWGIVLLVVDLWIPRDRKSWTALLAVLGMAIALGASFALFPLRQVGFNDMVVLDGFAIYADAIILVSAILVVGISYDYLQKMNIHRSEYYILLMISTSGMLLMVHAYDLIVVFLALELLSIPTYVLAGFARPKLESEEASLKYFLLGAFSSAFFLYGIALIYGGTAVTGLEQIVAVVANDALVNPSLFLLGAALLLVGLAFKVSAAPFHMWVPDVYQGAPSSVTVFMSVSVKVAGFAALLRIFVLAFPSLAGSLVPVLWGLSALTMVVGNLLAIVQNNIKRLLAYSSIAQVGYLMMAFVAYGQGQVVGNVISSILFYLVGYGFTSFAAWGVVLAAEQLDGRGLQLSDLAGFGRKYPMMGLAMIVAMFSFIGIPPTLGFWGKFYVFTAVIQAGSIGLALIGLLTSILSAYYYLRILVVMYMQPGDPVASRSTWVNVVTLASAAAVVLLAFLPEPLIQLAQQALMWLS